MPMAVHLVGAPHSGVNELLEALTAQLGVHAAQLHPLMQAQPGGAATLAASKEAIAMAAAPITFLTGLDWPCSPAEQEDREHRDAELRCQLQVTGTPYRVVYGNTERRLATALAALHASPQPAAASLTAARSDMKDGGAESDNLGSLKMRSWGCEKCSDPACEHRLFTSLRLASTR